MKRSIFIKFMRGIFIEKILDTVLSAVTFDISRVKSSLKVGVKIFPDTSKPVT